MMMKVDRAFQIGFVAALALGYGCSSTTTPPPTFVLSGKSYIEKFSCNEQFGGPPLSCSDLNALDAINFQSLGGDNFEVRNVPDSGFVRTGTLTGNTFTWTATSLGGYTESGAWTFSESGGTFSGSSHYVADPPGNFSGDCNTNGFLGAGIPPDPPLPEGCP